MVQCDLLLSAWDRRDSGTANYLHMSRVRCALRLHRRVGDYEEPIEALSLFFRYGENSGDSIHAQPHFDTSGPDARSFLRRDACPCFLAARFGCLRKRFHRSTGNPSRVANTYSPATALVTGNAAVTVVPFPSDSISSVPPSSRTRSLIPLTPTP